MTKEERAEGRWQKDTGHVNTERREGQAPDESRDGEKRSTDSTETHLVG